MHAAVDGPAHASLAAVTMAGNEVQFIVEKLKGEPFNMTGLSLVRTPLPLA